MLHNWSDEDCVQILKRSKEAICTREPKGKVVITEVVLGCPSKETLEAQLLMDLCMMVVLEGKESGGDMAQDFPRYRVHSVQDYSHLGNDPVTH